MCVSVNVDIDWLPMSINLFNIIEKQTLEQKQSLSENLLQRFECFVFGTKTPTISTIKDKDLTSNDISIC